MQTGHLYWTVCIQPCRKDYFCIVMHGSHGNMRYAVHITRTEDVKFIKILIVKSDIKRLFGGRTESWMGGQH